MIKNISQITTKHDRRNRPWLNTRRFLSNKQHIYIPSGFDERVELTEHSDEKKNDVYYIKIPDKNK